MIFTYLNVNKILDYFNVTLLLLLIFFNYLIYFILDTKSYFIFFSILILSTFLIILFKNLKSNFYIVLILLLMLLISLGSPVADWDARSIWLFNAKRIFYNQNLASYTNYLGSEFSHLDYPILIQTLSASLATLIGKWNEVFPKISSIIFALPAMLVISKIIKKLCPDANAIKHKSQTFEKEKRGYRLPGLFRARQLFETYFGCKIDWMQITDTEIKLEIEAERIAESEQEIMLDAYHESLDET